MSEEEREDRLTDATTRLTSNLLSLWDPWLRMGESLARTVAEATSGGKGVEEPEDAQRPLAAIVHYGWATVGNVLGVLTSGLNVVVKPTNGQSTPTTSPGPEPAVSRTPSVHRGSTLRIPLSIENPGGAGDYELSFTCTRLAFDGDASGPILESDAVRLEPNALVVAPYDFEKLTVLIDTHEDNAPGSYEAVIASEAGGFEIPLRFEIV